MTDDIATIRDDLLPRVRDLLLPRIATQGTIVCVAAEARNRELTARVTPAEHLVRISHGLHPHSCTRKYGCRICRAADESLAALVAQAERAEAALRKIASAAFEYADEYAHELRDIARAAITEDQP